MTILESGPVVDDANVWVIAGRLKDDGIGKAVVANVDENDNALISHYWVIKYPSGERIMYFGTPVTFERWSKNQQVN